nr:uncharacterized mitochondrial protein AtMg00810-like [Tanacetum cinerariifolium]
MIYDLTYIRRHDDDADKDEESSAGSDRGSKRRREGKKPESASTLKEKATRSASKSTQGSKSRQTSASESTTTEEPMQTTFDMEEPSHLEFVIGPDDQPIIEPSQHPVWFSQQKKPPTLDRDWNKTLPATYGSIQSWISELAKQSDSRSFFNKLMDTPMDFSAFLMNWLKVDIFTPELLAGPTYELMKGSCKSLVKLEFFLEEVYKATIDQLDWVNPEGQQYLHNLLKPLPLIPNSRGRRVILFDHFINNDLEYLRGGASSRKYTTSVTKTKAADYEHIKWIEDLVPRKIWIQEPVSYDKHALWGISHWGRKRQQFYGFAVNRESAHDITVRRDDDKLYKFKEGDFKRLHIQDIEDMLLLLVQGKLTNLTVEERFAFNVSLRMFTRSIVIQRRVKDLQLGIESYQNKLNLTRPDTYRSSLKHKEAYSAYSNPRGFIYQNKGKQNKLMRIDELHKFSDGTLTDVRTALDDHLKGIRMKYLPQTIWRKSDKDRAAAMIQVNDKQLKTKRIMRSLERSKSKNTGTVPTEMELILEHTQQGISHEVSLQKVGIGQRVETSDETMMDDVSNQGRMIVEMDQDADVVLEDDKEVADVVKDVQDEESAQDQGRKAESQAEIYKIDLEHANKVLSIQEDESEPAEVQEVVDVVTTAKIITEVVTAAIKTITATEAQARKNMMLYFKNVVGFKMDYFKGMSYDDICLIFEAKFNSNVAFLLKMKEQIKEEERRALKRLNETPAKKAAKRQILDKEVPVVDYAIIELNNKPYYKIIRADGTHQLYVSFLTLLRNFYREDLEALWSLVKERFSTIKPKNFSDDFLLVTLGVMFKKPNIHAQIWKNQRSVHGPAKVKGWKLLESCGLQIITFTTTQLILLVERKYPLTRFTLDQMLNAVRLEVDEESEVSLELLRACEVTLIKKNKILIHKIFLLFKMDSDAAHMVAASKDVIVNGNSIPKHKQSIMLRQSYLLQLQKKNYKKGMRSKQEAIEKMFGGNDATKKTQRILLKQQYKNFFGSSSESLDQTFDKLQMLVIWRNKPDLDTLSMDDLYNNLKVYKSKVKGISSSNNTQNMAFVSSASNNSNSSNGVNTTQGVNTANGVNTASSQVNDASSLNIDNLSDVVIYAFLASHPNSSHLVNKEGTTNYALMAYSISSASSLDSEVLDDEEENFEKKEVKPSIKWINFVKVTTENHPRETVKNALIVNAARPINVVHPKRTINAVNQESYFLKQSHSFVQRPKQKLTALKNSYANKNVKTVWVKKVNTTKPKAAVNAAKAKAKYKGIKGKRGNAVKALACWGNPQEHLQDKGVIDSSCSRHITGNMSFLTDYEEIDRGYVSFGGNPKGGKITGKGKIKTRKLDFENVYFVRELKFNLFSVSQICDKKNSVLFTDTECIVLSHDFKLIDENKILLRVLRQNNMYNINLKNIVPTGENLMNLRVKVIRCDNETKFKNREMNQFCEVKGIMRQYSVARTPQQNKVAERRNMTLIEADRTMLEDSKLPTTFWAEAVNTACYVQNSVLVTKPHNMTPYELFHGRTHVISFLRPFGCPNTILNTIYHLGKFDEKADEGFFVGYSLNSKAFRVFNSRTKIVEENLHVRFNENTPNNIGTKASNGAGKEKEPERDYILLPLWTTDSPFSTTSKNADFHNLDSTFQVSHISTIKIHKDHPLEQVIGDLNSAPQTRRMTKNLEEHGLVGTVIPRTYHKDLEYLLVSYLNWNPIRSTKKEMCDAFEILMHEKIQMSSMGELTFFLGLQVKQKKEGVFISQDKYIAEILKKFRFLDVKKASTPMETSKPLLKDKDGEEVDIHMYRSMIGSLMYLTSSMPDIMFDICACARYQIIPKVSYLLAVKRIFRYLKGQPKLGLWCPRDSPFELMAYTDSDYAGASLDRKSTTGGCQFFGVD